MRQPWLYFWYWIHASVMNSFSLSIPYVSCHSVFVDDFKVYRDSVFANDLWISRDIVFLTITCVSHDSIFAIYLMCWSWIHWRCRFQGLQRFCFRWRFMDQPWHSIFDNSIRQPWLYFGYRFHMSNDTQFSVMILRCTVTQVSLTINGSAVT
jgi:hypothetical protein